jgi:anti-sigma factor RsiW
MKAALSAYLDDELTRSERLDADAHLVACAPCRALVERAEALDATLAARFVAEFDEAGASLADLDPSALAARTEDAVLAAIGKERRAIRRPRLAAAAAIAVAAAAIAFVAWRARESGAPLAPAAVGSFASAPEPGGRQPPAATDPVAPPTESAALLASLTPDERQALYNTSVVLGMAARTTFADEDRRTELRETVRYDELVDRLGEVLLKLPAEARATVALARDAAARVAAGESDPESWARLREDVDANRLRRSVDVLSMLE